MDLESFKHYREEDQHECNLLSSRINTLLYSQALFAVAASFLYPKDIDKDQQLILPFMVISLAGFWVAVFTLAAICIGCRVIREWHLQYTEFVTKHKGGSLHGYVLPERKLPDLRHTISIDIFSWSLPVILGIAWLAAIWYVGGMRWWWLKHWVWMAGGSVCWLFAAACLLWWVLSASAPKVECSPDVPAVPAKNTAAGL